MSEKRTHEIEMKLYNDDLELHQMKQKKHVDMIIKNTCGMRRAFVIVWGQCTQNMKCTLESINEFEKTKLNRDPMKLH